MIAYFTIRISLKSGCGIKDDLVRPSMLGVEPEIEEYESAEDREPYEDEAEPQEKESGERDISKLLRLTLRLQCLQECTRVKDPNNNWLLRKGPGTG